MELRKGRSNTSLKGGKRKRISSMSRNKKKKGVAVSETYTELKVQTRHDVLHSDAGDSMANIISDENIRFDSVGGSTQDDSGDNDSDREKHWRVLQGVTGMPIEAFDGKEKRNACIVEPYRELAHNPSGDVLASDGHVTIEDLVESLKGKSGYSQLRKRTEQINKKSGTLVAPLPKVDQDRFERKAAYESSKKDITKWDPLVKRNREAPTIIFDRDTDVGFSSVGAIASEFVPRTEFEKKIAAVVSDDKIMEAHNEDGSKLLELNKVTLEDYRKQRNQIAKMRGLLFRHEMKMKRIKKIKSKTFRRISKKDRSKLELIDSMLDPEAAKEQALKQEFKRAEERMTLRHKNRSKWAKRILNRGLSVHDDGTRAAIAEQLNEHERLTRKMNGNRESSDDSSDEEEDGDLSGFDEDNVRKMLTNAKESTLKVLDEDEGMPKTGVLSLPFMIRGLKKKEEEAAKEANLAIHEYEASLNQFTHKDGIEKNKVETVKGRREFGPSVKQVRTKKMIKRKIDSDTDSDNGADPEFEAVEDVATCSGDGHISQAIKYSLSSTPKDSLFEEFEDVRKSDQKSTYEVSIFASGKWKKMASENDEDKNARVSSDGAKTTLKSDLEEARERSDTDSEGERSDEDLFPGPKTTYQLPSQEELVREAFASDDIEDEFAKDKEAIANEENPPPEKLVMLPGWGQWTNVQRKKGLPSWMIDEHERAKRKRDEALQRRKDALLKHVIISEKFDKKEEKLHSKSLPYPFTSNEAFDQSMRMPIGPEFNPVSVVGALNRPEVLKRSGVIINPVKFEEPDRNGKPGDHKRKGHEQNNRRDRAKGKSANNLKPVISKS